MTVRKGLRIRINKSNAEIANHFKLFAAWLRKHYDFPIRLPVYLSDKKYVVDKEGESCVSIFFAPYDNQVEPYIKIATGDFQDLVEERGKESAVFDILFSFALDIKKYQKWLASNSTVDGYDATEDATELLQSYIDDSIFDFSN